MLPHPQGAPWRLLLVAGSHAHKYWLLSIVLLKIVINYNSR